VEFLNEGNGVGVGLFLSVLLVYCVVETIRLVLDDLKALEMELDLLIH
jgi:hypothetical protein